MYKQQLALLIYSYFLVVYGFPRSMKQSSLPEKDSTRAFVPLKYLGPNTIPRR